MKQSKDVINTMGYINLLTPKSINSILNGTFQIKEESTTKELLDNLKKDNWDYNKYISHMLYNLSSYINLFYNCDIKELKTNLSVISPLMNMYFLTAVTFQPKLHKYKPTITKKYTEHLNMSNMLIYLETITSSIESDDLWTSSNPYSKFMLNHHIEVYLQYTNVDIYLDILSWIINRIVHIHKLNLDAIINSYIDTLNSTNEDYNLDKIATLHCNYTNLKQELINA